MKNVTNVDKRFLRLHPLPKPSAYSDKNRRGRVFMIGGGESAPGAVLLAATAALRAGAGKVQIGVGGPGGAILGLMAPELGIIRLARTSTGDPAVDSQVAFRRLLVKTDAALLGPGLADARNALRLALRSIRTAQCPLVIDAQALIGLWPHCRAMRRSAIPLIITPHHGEMAALTGRSERAISANPHRVALEAAKRLNCFVVLKGPDTLVVSPQGQMLVHAGGVVGLGTAGSGDVLAGLLTGLLARGASPLIASAWAVHTHAAAGASLTRSVGQIGFLARELPPLFPGLIERFMP